tara:strand:- start:300 stop:989 length:690 start_codon:yes stop_codon:yes gene_type:complete
MRIILIFIFFSILSSSSNADEIIFDELKIKDEKHKLIKSNMSIISRFEEAKFMNNFYYYSEDKILNKFIDIAFFNATMYPGQATAWFRNFALKKKSKQTCVSSEKNIFLEVKRIGSHISCLNIRFLDENKLASPNFINEPKYFPLERRKSIIKKIIKKNELNFPKKMIRAEHYFYRAGDIYWVLTSSQIDKDSEKKIDLFIKNTFKEHSRYEEQIRLNTSVMLDFQTYQ